MPLTPELLEKVRHPLEHAANDEKLDKTIRALVEEGLAGERDPARKELLRELKIVFLTWDEADLTERRRKVGSALELVVALEKMAGVATKPTHGEGELPAVVPREKLHGEGELPAVVPREKLHGEGELPAVVTPQPRSRPTPPARPAISVVPPPPPETVPKWLATAETEGDDEGDDDEEDEEVTPNTPIPMPDADAADASSGAGILPVPAAGQPAAPGEGGRRRRRRGGRRRRKGQTDAPGVPGSPAPAAGSAPGAPQTPRPPRPPREDREVTRPNMRLPQPPASSRSSSEPAPHPEAGPIRILAADPPLPLREGVGPRPVVRPGDEPLPENTDEGMVIAVEGALARDLEPIPRTSAPPPPRIDDVRAALARLSSPASEVKGVGPKTGELLGLLNMNTVEDLLFDVPRSYQDRGRLTKIGKLEAGKVETVTGTVKSRAAVRFGLRPGFEVIVEDETGWIRAKWFHVHRGMEERFPVGAKVIFAGKFEKYRDKLEVTHPEIEVIDETEGPESFARVQPVYPLTEGLSQKVRRKIQNEVVAGWGKDVPPSTPYWARQKRGFLAPSEALTRVHEPETGDDAVVFQEGKSPWHRSLAYDELFSLQVGLALRRRAAGRERAPRLKITHALIAKLAALLPFPLTDAQEKVLAEIKRDLLMQRPMHRLLQGDVGSGKTIVALMAALVPIENRMQVAFMAPTEILAEQHYDYVRNTLERIGVHATLLLGGMPKAAKDEATKRIANGDVDIVVGTHALLSDNVQFKNLAFAIIDEQHRFGVIQRQTLKQKGQAPHVLIMTATPIPRTLALTEFGDLDVSVIDRMPAGRSPVDTRVCGEEERSVVYAQVRSDVSAGRQAYIVYPTIEGAEDDASVAGVTEGQKRLQRDVFPEFRVGIIHGRMTREEKEGVMTRFKNGAVDILAATTVVEVGIDVPNATVMVVEHAERFGMSQLHQLRGRVGRGAAKSRAFFMLGVGSLEDARERVGVLERTVDGFEVAQADLDNRGQGDITGTKQSGLPPFRMADPLRDLDLLIMAREDAFTMVNADPKLREPEHRVVHEVVRHRWRGRLNLTDTG